ncbi:6-phosphogluconolactonase [Sulfitobacter sp. F26169L]|uniref:6-phosphogluconolactonase n=1 Tax=Sulfitobacter sp. F26169L TaxID=2996015 RepID=UPI002260868B|nr:6-phosphogluconolactonase [Sulfitobacter sp. F26169L]MCX7565418.1 6-phosphogluconolactonase [Sulfitobacter sp. F26169L]
MAEDNTMNIVEYPDRDTLMTQVAEVLTADLATALERKQSVTLVVPGGSTPGPVFDILSTAEIDWTRVHILLSDERWVPEDNAQSNAALIRKRLLVNKAAAARFTPYFRPDDDIETAARSLSGELTGCTPFDVLLLGMGADMHTASLFPDTLALAAALKSDAQMFLPVTIAGQDTARFTLTAPSLRSARTIRLLVTGENKRKALAHALTLPAAQAPVQIVLPRATIHWSAT